MIANFKIDEIPTPSVDGTMIEKLELLLRMIILLDVEVLAHEGTVKYSAKPFIESLLDQARVKGSLSKKQLIASNKVYRKYKKRLDKHQIYDPFQKTP